ncbi:MAG: hypothetical protein H6752_16245 [Candidatus Omnitrophica bacterium]|nr:hypothetical protein [Candidatus Omnitrophota bacterium]
MEMIEAHTENEKAARSLLIAKTAFWLGVINTPIIPYTGITGFYLAWNHPAGAWFVAYLSSCFFQSAFGITFLIQSGLLKNRKLTFVLLGVGQGFLLPAAFFLSSLMTTEKYPLGVCTCFFFVVEFIVGFAIALKAGAIHRSFVNPIYFLGVGIWGVSVPFILLWICCLAGCVLRVFEVLF